MITYLHNPLFFRVIFYCYALLITIFSILPASHAHSALDLNSYGILFLDKLLHILAYALFVVLGCVQCKSRTTYTSLALSIAIYGILLECIQHVYIHNRTGSFSDAMANIAGVYLGYYAYIAYKRIT